MKASFSFVLAALSCATTTLLANSPASKNVHLATVRTQTQSIPLVAKGPITSFGPSTGSRSFSPRVKAPVHLCLSCALTSNAAGNIAANAIGVSGIQSLTSWNGTQDSAGSGTASGISGLVTTPALSGNARQFLTTYTNGGSERFYTTFGADQQATHFFYDAWLYVAAPSGTVANVEMDMNQVTANGQTVIYGVQCDGYSNTWDYTANQGTPQNPVDVWIHSNATCNPRNWAANAWHHVQMNYWRDSAGNVTYGSIWFDGAQQAINQTVPSSFALGWGSVLLTNFQVDGYGASGSTTVYLDNLEIYRW